ncbi:hypothetical protein KKC1_03900 [Calderihabitans maritimus]|uniref:Uncharacterized protein n=1 Tax=Calderihabitans maritimus TaxID=1246530 RepID=A0A1Z5HP66_9FIRM|nr:hypothetical protein KKC1_03900 [Calderihabitans maritimus]
MTARSGFQEFYSEISDRFPAGANGRIFFLGDRSPFIRTEEKPIDDEQKVIKVIPGQPGRL